MSKLVFISALFLQLGLLCGPVVFFFFIAMVTSFLFLYIYPRVLLVTVSFLFGLCALLGDVGVSFSVHLTYLSWVETLFGVLEVHSIEEQSIGVLVESSLASALTTV